MIAADVEDIYELSPLQAGIYHLSSAHPDDGLYLVLLRYRFEGSLDAAAFERAFRRVVDRHPVLRTSFHWEGTEKPLQVVHRSVELPVRVEDWCDLSKNEQDERLSEHLRLERARGIPLSEAPLMRLALFRLGPESNLFLWSFHHIVIEGWSASIVLDEVFRLYRAFCRGEDVDLPRRRPYRDYVLWLQRQDPREQEGYWRKTLRGFTAPNEIGGIRKARSAPKSNRYGRLVVSFSPGTSEALEALTKRYRVTASTFFQGAWAILLALYSGRRDVVYGSVVSGRQIDLEGAESIVGLMVNTLPARVRLSDDAPLGSWLGTLQKDLAEMRRFEHSALVDVQGFSDVPRGVPLFRTLFAFQNWLGSVSAERGGSELAVADAHGFEGGTDYPLAVEVHPAPALTAVLFYDREWCEEDVVTRLGEQLRRLAIDMIEMPERTVGSFVGLRGAERAELVHEFNETARPYEREATIAELFERRAALSADRVAVRYGEHELTYHELDRRADRIAATLQEVGVGPERVVGLYAERSLPMIVGMLGILKAGGAYLPLDPSYPEERLRYMVADSGAGWVLASRGLAAGARFEGVQVLDLEEAQERGREGRATSGKSPTGLAYVMYTSGSTGSAKGVEVSDRGVVRLVRGADYVALGPDDVVAQASNASFDAATFEIWGALLAGARLEGIAKEEMLAASELSRRVRESGVSTLFLTTALFHQLVREDPTCFAPLSQLLFGGESIDPDRVAEALASGAPGRLLHVYGPTENTTFSTWHLVTDVPEGSATVPIGRAIANSRVYVLDDELSPAPVGAVGEIYVAGDGLARGYRGRPELTAERFLPDPFSERPGERMYRTGDLGRWNGSGSLEFGGRADEQVKIRGFRVEPAEIESALLERRDVAAALVLVREDEPGDRRLAAYVVPESRERALLPDEVKAHLVAKLPGYMVPSAVVVLDAFPLSSNGKIDRRALPRPDVSAGALAFAPPASELEKIVAGIWQKVLGVERVGLHDNFFDLGGHSLHVSRVHAELRDALHPRRVSIVELFEHPTVHALARHLGSAEPKEPPSEPAPPSPSRSEGMARLRRRREAAETAEEKTG